MKIVFICGSLEPDRDGVGDYTMRLASELALQGHKITALALYDPYLKKEVEGNASIIGQNKEIHIMRLPSLLKAKKRFEKAKKLIDCFNPDWISLQYVPYSYHYKGLPFGVGNSFKKIIEGRNCHIMFHELWVGISKISPLTHKVTGFFQRKIVDSIVHATTPKLITTTNRLYQSLLSARSIDSSILPLFSNIRVAPRDDLFVSKVYKELTINESEIDQYLITGIFGELHSGAKIQKALTELLRCYKDENRKIVFIGFGKISAKGLNEFRRLENHLSDKIKFLHLGIQTEGHISNLLQLLDTAFSCTPSLHIGKSGVFAAMKLHGVRIVLPEEDTIPEYRLEIRKFNEEYMNRPSCNWNVSNIANHFSTLLSAIDD